MMKIVHRIGINDDQEMKDALDRYGIDYDATPPVISFDIDESVPYWPEIQALIRTWKAVDCPRLEFTRREVEEAEYLEIMPTTHTGYPQPDGNFGYLNETFDLSDYCKKCGIGARQNRPFRVKRSSQWSANRILQLNWVFDELFVSHACYTMVFEPLGIKSFPVIDHRTGAILPTAVQLRIDALAGPVPGLEMQPSKACAVCGRTKVLPLQREALTLPSAIPGTPLFKTAEIFGDGASAFRHVIAHRTVRERLEAIKMRGVTWQPVVS